MKKRNFANSASIFMINVMPGESDDVFFLSRKSCGHENLKA